MVKKDLNQRRIKREEIRNNCSDKKEPPIVSDRAVFVLPIMTFGKVWSPSRRFGTGHGIGMARSFPG
jgi:hypothetical protein